MLKHVIVWMAYGYYLLLKSTLRFKETGREIVEEEISQGKFPVYACSHGVLLPCVVYYDGFAVGLLASKSKDGELIARLLRKRGFLMVRGSSSRGGKEALLELKEISQKGHPIGITVDGPKGPPLIPKNGIASCAAATNGSLYFTYVKPLSPLFMRLGSWDKFLLPFPFCKFEFIFEKIELPYDVERDLAWQQLAIEKLKSRMQEIYGHVYSSKA